MTFADTPRGRHRAIKRDIPAPFVSPSRPRRGRRCRAGARQSPSGHQLRLQLVTARRLIRSHGRRISSRRRTAVRAILDRPREVLRSSSSTPCPQLYPPSSVTIAGRVAGREQPLGCRRPLDRPPARRARNTPTGHEVTASSPLAPLRRAGTFVASHRPLRARRISSARHAVRAASGTSSAAGRPRARGGAGCSVLNMSMASLLVGVERCRRARRGSTVPAAARAEHNVKWCPAPATTAATSDLPPALDVAAIAAVDGRRARGSTTARGSTPAHGRRVVSDYATRRGPPDGWSISSTGGMWCHSFAAPRAAAALHRVQQACSAGGQQPRSMILVQVLDRRGAGPPANELKAPYGPRLYRPRMSLVRSVSGPRRPHRRSAPRSGDRAGSRHRTGETSSSPPRARRCARPRPDRSLAVAATRAYSARRSPQRGLVVAPCLLPPLARVVERPPLGGGGGRGQVAV